MSGPVLAPYQFTHIEWREYFEDDEKVSISNLADVAQSKEEALSKVSRLLMNPKVFALRVIHCPNTDNPDEAEITRAAMRIGPPVTA